MKKLKIAAVALLALIVAGIVTYRHLVYISYNDLTVNNYEIKAENIASNIKLVVIGDLHDNTFNDNDDNLVATIKSQKPDLIIADGDMLNGDSQNSDIAISLIKRLVKIAPVYYALGNHEIEYMEKNGDGLISEIKEAGATLLEMEYEDIEINGTKIRIGGMYGYAFDTYSGECVRNKMAEGIYDFLREFEATDNYKIMMSHRPDSFIFGQASKKWYIDLVVSSHDHGGQVVLPFFGGLYGGDQGYFPEYIHGLYEKDNLKLLITSGLGSHTQKLPRFNNVPEVMVANISN